MMMRASRTATVELLTQQGHLIAGTADGIASALAAMHQGNIDVLVLDMHMPNPEGDPGDAGLVVLRRAGPARKRGRGWSSIHPAFRGATPTRPASSGPCPFSTGAQLATALDRDRLGLDAGCRRCPQ